MHVTCIKSRLITPYCLFRSELQSKGDYHQPLVPSSSLARSRWCLMPVESSGNSSNTSANSNTSNGGTTSGNASTGGSISMRLLSCLRSLPESLCAMRGLSWSAWWYRMASCLCALLSLCVLASELTLPFTSVPSFAGYVVLGTGRGDASR